ncbi:hypothetical protein NCC49_003780 [Naganishia albida]|nr:hypothetical protein NCC49_003780 [Naganishia albida]
MCFDFCNGGCAFNACIGVGYDANGAYNFVICESCHVVKMIFNAYVSSKVHREVATSPAFYEKDGSRVQDFTPQPLARPWPSSSWESTPVAEGMQRSILRVDTTQQGPVVAPQHVNERQARANSNVVEKDYDSDESMEEDSDSDEEALSTVVAREGRERLFAIDELRQGLIRVLGSAQCDKSMLARTQSNTHGYATPVEKEAEPADEPTFWTKSG